jgi:hypothetical protein
METSIATFLSIHQTNKYNNIAFQKDVVPYWSDRVWLLLTLSTQKFVNPKNSYNFN